MIFTMPTEQTEPKNEHETSGDGSEAYETEEKNSEGSASSDNEAKSYGGQGFVSRSAGPMTASPFDTSESGVSNMETSIGADYWLCPYCPDFTAENIGAVRDHITDNGDDLHAGQSGWSHNRHIPGFDSDDELVGAVLGITNASDPSGLMSVDEIPDGITFQTHEDTIELIPMSLQEKEDDTDTDAEDATNAPTETTEEPAQEEQSTETNMNSTIASADENPEESVIAWVCPYCLEPNENEHAMRLHINHSSAGGHEEKDGWNLADQVPGISADGNVIAILKTGTAAEEGDVIPISELDNPPEMDQADLAALDDEIGELDVELDGEEAISTDERRDSGTSTEPLNGDKKIEVVNAWVSAGDLEEELDLDEDEEFSPEDVSEVSDGSYSYCYTVGRSLENDEFDPDELEAALDDDLQSKYREGFEQVLEDRSETPEEEESDKDSQEEADASQQPDSDTEAPDESTEPVSPTTPESETTGKTDELVNISRDEEDTAASTDQTAQAADSDTGAQTTEVADQDRAVVSSEPTEESSISPTQHPIDRIERDTVDISVEEVQAIQETLERYKSGAKADAEAFSHNQVVRARADEREHVAQRISEMIASLVPEPETPQQAAPNE